MSDNITVRGFVATEVKTSTTPGGVATAWFRIGSTDRRYDRATNTWVNGTTNWFAVQAYRQLAGNIGCSIKKGQPVVVTGRLKLRSWEKDGRIHHVVEIDADSVGHDLMWGSANFIRAAVNGAQAATGPSGPAALPPDDNPEENGENEENDQDYGVNNDDDVPATHGVFVDDVSGEAEELDEETGELKGAAA